MTRGGERATQRETSRAYRERYPGYNAGYQRARSRAARLFRQRHPVEWAAILAEETAGTTAADRLCGRPTVGDDGTDQINDAAVKAARERETTRKGRERVTERLDQTKPKGADGK